MIGTPGRDGFGTVTPYLIAAKADEYVRFLTAAFGAEVTYRTHGERGGTHVEVQIGTSRVMVGEDANGGPPAYLFLYVEDARAVVAAALTAGASEMMPVAEEQFQEHLGGAVTDPEGNSWFVAQRGPKSVAP